MFTNIKLQNAVVDFVREITDCNQTLVFYLVMSASVSSIDSVTVELSRQIDLLTGCGFDYVFRYVRNLNTLYNV